MLFKLYLYYTCISVIFRFLKGGGEIIKRKVDSFEEMLTDYDIVFNCTGLAATQLTPDSELIPNRGQLVRADTRKNAAKTFVFIFNGTPNLPYYVWT